MKNKIFQSLISALVFVLFTIIVWAVANLVISNEAILPSIGSVFSKVVFVVGQQQFLQALANTLLHTIIGFLISFTLGFVLAVLASRYKLIRRLCVPFVSMIRLVPTMAIALMAYLWVDKDVAPALVAFIVVMPTVYSQSIASFDLVDGELLEMAKIYSIPTSRVIGCIYLPITADSIIECIASSLSLTLKITIASEVLVGSSSSIGQLMQIAQQGYSDSALFFAIVVWAIFIGLVIEWTIRIVYFGIKRGVYAKKYNNK